MGVDAAEAERVDSGPARCATVGWPWSGLDDRGEAGTGQRPVRVVAVQGGRQHPMVHRQGGLDQPSDAGGRHRVADHRLDRSDADVATGAVRRSEDRAERGQFGLVAGLGRGAVCLQQTESTRFGGIQVGSPPGPLDGPHLALGARAHQAARPAVAGYPGSADHCVDPVVAGVGQPLEHHNSGALADEDAVGAAVEGPDPLAGAQRSELAEHAPQRDVVAVVHSAGEHDVAASGGQLRDGMVDGDQR